MQNFYQKVIFLPFYLFIQEGKLPSVDDDFVIETRVKELFTPTKQIKIRKNNKVESSPPSIGFVEKVKFFKIKPDVVK